MRASMAKKLLVYVCIGVAILQSTMGALACGPGCKCSPKKCPTTPPPTPVESPPCPPPPTTPTTPTTSTCSIDYKKLGSCAAPLLGGLLGIGSQCCGLLGLLDLDVVVCLCLALDVNILGIVDIKVDKLDAIVTILTSCNRPVPKNLSCPS